MPQDESTIKLIRNRIFRIVQRIEVIDKFTVEEKFKITEPLLYGVKTIHPSPVLFFPAHRDKTP